VTISTILFDAGDILYHRPRRKAAIEAFLTGRGYPRPAEPDPFAKQLRRDAHAGKMSEAAFFERLLAHYGVQEPRDVEDGVRLLYGAQRDLVFFEDVPETLHELKRRGVKLGVVTNTYNSKQVKYEWFGPLGIDEIWDSYASSCELKLIKPDPKIYHAALDPLGVSAVEAAFVGHAQSELDGAKALGMTTIAFNPDPDCSDSDHRLERFKDLLKVPGIAASGSPAESAA
jgi:HAD superfamily hydrolase (TIGR01509 family)